METRLPKIDFPPYEQHGICVSGFKELDHVSIKDTTQPVMVGHTHVDRHPQLIKSIADVCDHLRNAKKQPVKILFAPCSVGYEPLSFARELSERNKLQPDFVQIHALDKNENFLKCAKEFVIPIATLNKERLRNWLQYLDFTQKSPNTLAFIPEITQHIHFKEAQDLYTHEDVYDALVMMNFFYHIDGEQEKHRILHSAFQKASTALTMDKYSYLENPEICLNVAKENGFVFLNKAMRVGCYDPTPGQLFNHLQATFVRADTAKEIGEILKQKIENERAKIYGKNISRDTDSPAP
ncbi:MAG: hypothetical protein IT559_04675 [Alphaproteobacteria bacterium]|nr:hypothetical protein [Alphaproteobacteria bacterium]